MKFSDKLYIVQLVAFLFYLAAGGVFVGTIVLSIAERQLLLVGLLYSAGLAFHGLLLQLFVDAARRVDIINNELRLFRLEFHETKRRQPGTQTTD